MLTPKDMIKLEEQKFPEDEIIKKIDNEIRSNFGKFNYQMASLEEIIPLRIRHKIAAKYARCGWKFVYHIAGEEKNYCFEKTNFYFSMEPIIMPGIDNYYLVQKSEIELNEFVVHRDEDLIEKFSLDGE